MPRISCTQTSTGPRVRLSLGKGAGGSGNPRNYTGNRGCEAPGFWCGDKAQEPVHSSDLHSKDVSYFVKRGRLPEDDASGDNHSDLCSGTSGTDNR
jgi:hypothetical protein